MYRSMYIEYMSKRYSIAEARSNLPAIVDQAEAGVAIELTRRGRPVAVVVSPRHLERLQSERPGFGDAYKSFLKKYSLEEIGLDSDFFACTRLKDAGRDVSL